MIVSVNEANLPEAAAVHSASWQESHRAFCAPDFVAQHSPARQEAYLRAKIKAGASVFMLVLDRPVGIVSVTRNLIEDLYVLPAMQRRGYGSLLLRYAIDQCQGTPTLWVLENNVGAARLYQRCGFVPTGRTNRISGKIAEIEYCLYDEHD